MRHRLVGVIGVLLVGLVAGCSGSDSKQPRLANPNDPKVKDLKPAGGEGPGAGKPAQTKLQ